MTWQYYISLYNTFIFPVCIDKYIYRFGYMYVNDMHVYFGVKNRHGLDCTTQYETDHGFPFWRPFWCDMKRVFGRILRTSWWSIYVLRWMMLDVHSQSFPQSRGQIIAFDPYLHVVIILLLKSCQMGVSINEGTPNGWFTREHPIEMDDNRGTPISGNPPIMSDQSIASRPCTRRARATFKPPIPRRGRWHQTFEVANFHLQKPSM